MASSSSRIRDFLSSQTSSRSSIRDAPVPSTPLLASTDPSSRGGRTQRPMGSETSSQPTFNPATTHRYISNGNGNIKAETPKELDRKITPLMSLLPQVNVVPSPQSPPLCDIEGRDAQSPLKLFFQDAGTFGHIMFMLPYALIPADAKDDGDVKLTKSWRGRRDTFLISFVSVLQLILLPLGFICWSILPGLVSLLLGVVVWGLMYLMLKVTRGTRFVDSQVPLNGEGGRDPRHSGEQWIFINGIMTGHVGLQNAVDGLSRVFQRPILGIHNETSGFFGDIFECLIQRCFSYCTEDVRVAYDRLYGVLKDDSVHKVVLIAHSQGGIIASLCIDYLFTKLPEECMAKLEVYTFGSAASHFNNPTHNPDDTPSPLSSISRRKSVANINAASSPDKPPITVPASPSSSSPVIPVRTSSASLPGLSCPHHVISYIEHYANSMDPIPRWGVLHSVYALLSPRYSGTVFVRLGASGHLFTSHYLAAWFPTDAAEAQMIGAQTVGLEHAVLRERAATSKPAKSSKMPTKGTNSKQRETGTIQLSSVGGVVGVGDFDGSAATAEPGRANIIARADTMVWGDQRPAGMKLLDDVEQARKALTEGQLNFVAEGEGYVRSMKGMSRLWAYVDGACPAD